MFGLLSIFFSQVSVAGHSWREGTQDVKDCRHVSASALPDGTKPVGTQCRHCDTSAFTIRCSMTCVWNTSWAQKCWCLGRSQQIPREVLGFVPQWRQGQLWPLFFTLSSCDLLRDIFLENKLMWPDKNSDPKAMERTMSFFLCHDKTHLCLVSVGIFHCRQTPRCEKTSKIIFFSCFHLGPYGPVLSVSVEVWLRK